MKEDKDLDFNSDNDIENLNNLSQIRREDINRKNSDSFSEYSNNNNRKEKEKLLEGTDKFEQNITKHTSQKEKNKIPSVKTTEKNIKLLLIYLSISSFIFLAQIIIGAIQYSKYRSFFGIFFLILGVFGVLLIIFSIMSLFLFFKKYKTFCDNWKDASSDVEILESANEYDKLMKSKEASCLNLIMYLIIIWIIIYLFYSCLTFYYREIRGELNAIANKLTAFNNQFGNYITFDEIFSKMKKMNIVNFCICLIIIILLCFLLYETLKVLGFFDICPKLVKYISLIYLQFSIMFLFLALYFYRFQNIYYLNREFVYWLPNCLVYGSIFQILISIIAFISSSNKNKIGLNICVAIGALYVSMLLVFSFISIKNVKTINEYSEMKCPSLQNFFNQKFMKKKCEKYNEINNSLEKLNCPKERIVTYWEKNIELSLNNSTNKYGCININCCFQIQNYIQTLQYILAVFCFTGVGLTLIYVGSLVYLINYLDEGKWSLIDEKQSQIFILCFIFSTIIIFNIILSYSSDPEHSPGFDQLKKVSNNSIDKIQKNYFSPISVLMESKLTNLSSIIYKDYIEKYTILENYDLCFDKRFSCNAVNYKFEIMSDKYNLSISKKDIEKYGIIVKDSNALEKGTKSLILYSNLELTKKIFEILKIKYDNDCEMEYNPIYIKLSAVVVSNDYKIDPKIFFFKDHSNLSKKKYKEIVSNIIKEIESAANQKDINIFKQRSENGQKEYTIIMNKLTKGEIYNVYNEYYYFTIFNHSLLISLDGYLVSYSNDNNRHLPLSDMDIYYRFNNFKKCGFVKIKTDSKGYFKTKSFLSLKNNIIQEITFETQNNNGFLSTEKTILINNNLLKKTKSDDVVNINIGYLIAQEKIINNSSLLYSLGSYVIDGINISPISQANIHFYEGEVYFPNKQSDDLDISYNEMNNEYLLASVQTDEKGQFLLEEIIDKKIYTIFIRKKNYYNLCQVLYINQKDIKNNFINSYLSFSLIPKISRNKEMIISLTWDKNPYDLNIFTFFKIRDDFECKVFYGNQVCHGVYQENINYNNGTHGVQTMTIEKMGNFIYTFSVRKFMINDNPQKRGENKIKSAFDKAPIEKFPEFMRKINDVDNKKNIKESKASIKVYLNGYENEIFSVSTQDLMENEISDGKWWVAFCLDGSKGIKSIVKLNKFVDGEVNYKFCEEWYKNY